MLVLALDTSTRTGSVAVARDGQVVVEAAGDPTRLHAARLPGWLLETLDAADATLADVDRLAVLAGPGGFTGLRVGLATIQGLAVGLDRQVFMASTLEVLAWGAHLAMPGAAVAGAWMRGMRGEIFTAVYVPDPSAGPSGLAALLPPLVDAPAGAAAQWRAAIPADATVVLTGDGWEGEGAVLGSHLAPQTLTWLPVGPPAGLLARLASGDTAVTVSAPQVVPTYIRRPDAVLTRERAGTAVTGDT